MRVCVCICLFICVSCKSLVDKRPFFDFIFKIIKLFSLFQVVLQDAIEALFTVKHENNKKHLYIPTWLSPVGSQTHLFLKPSLLSTSSRSHSKQKGPARFPCVFLSSDNHLSTLNVSEWRPQMCAICRFVSRGGWETCWSEGLVREIHIHGNTSPLAWWFLKWLIRLQQLAKEESGSRGGQLSSFWDRPGFSFCGFHKRAKRKITCWRLRCKRSAECLKRRLFFFLVINSRKTI